MRQTTSTNVTSVPDLGEIDGLFHKAGLVRSLRGKSGAGVRARLQSARFDRAVAEEVSRLAPPACIAENSVQWLAVPGWQKVPDRKSTRLNSSHLGISY